MSLILYVGCQKARKTISNINKSTEYVDVFNEQGLFINSAIDTRDKENILSSNSSSYRGVSDRFTCIKVNKLSEVYEKVNLDLFPIISLDEIQFFHDLVEFVVDLLKRGKFCVCSGLDTDWMGKDFGQVKELLKYSTEFRKMSAKCKWCIDDDTTKDPEKISNACRTGKISGSKEQIECGGDDKYIPLCMKHHHWHLIHLHSLDPYTLESIEIDIPQSHEIDYKRKRKISDLSFIEDNKNLLERDLSLSSMNDFFPKNCHNDRKSIQINRIHPLYNTKNPRYPRIQECKNPRYANISYEQIN